MTIPRLPTDGFTHDALRALLSQPDEPEMPARGHRYIDGMTTADPSIVRQSYVVKVLRLVLRRVA